MNEPFPPYGQNEFPPMGEFHPTYVHAPQPDLASQRPTQYNIVIKRNDALYRTLSILNSVLSVIGVLVIVATFVTVCYGVMMISEVFDTVTIIQNQQVP
jgi:hypothetical protein